MLCSVEDGLKRKESRRGGGERKKKEKNRKRKEGERRERERETDTPAKWFAGCSRGAGKGSNNGTVGARPEELDEAATGKRSRKGGVSKDVFKRRPVADTASRNRAVFSTGQTRKCGQDDQA